MKIITLCTILFSSSILFTPSPTTPKPLERKGQLPKYNHTCKHTKPTPPEQPNNENPYNHTHWEQPQTISERITNCVDTACLDHDCLGLRIAGACLVTNLCVNFSILPILNYPTHQNMS